MMSPLFLEPRLHPSIVKFFALIRLHVERSPRRGLLVNAFQSTYHVLAAFRFDGDGPGILGQDIDHGQQIFVPLIPSTEFFACPPNPFAIVRLGQRPTWEWWETAYVGVCGAYNQTPIGESVALAGFSISGPWQRDRPHPRPRVPGDLRKRVATTRQH